MKVEDSKIAQNEFDTDMMWSHYYAFIDANPGCSSAVISREALRVFGVNLGCDIEEESVYDALIRPPIAAAWEAAIRSMAKEFQVDEQALDELLGDGNEGARERVMKDIAKRMNDLVRDAFHGDE